ncbi:hypothetical protein D3C71_2122400 [compost metagenome]
MHRLARFVRNHLDAALDPDITAILVPDSSGEHIGRMCAVVQYFQYTNVVRMIKLDAVLADKLLRRKAH